ncbi:MAG: dihydropteroate synthase [Gemmatimonadaceae bacterium]|nr:dihydropteroate synthase [Gemmatimonadaceae bacterium]
MSRRGDSSPQTPPAANAARWRLRDGWLDLGARPHIMAICNVTPDSFSDGGEHYSVELAVQYAECALHDGATLFDIGGESTRPGARPVDADVELARVMPVIEAVHERVPDLIISVDTVKATVAEAALASGARVINDVSGGRLDARMFDVIARSGAGVVLMHSRGSVTDMATYAMATYGGDVTQDVCDALVLQADAARAAGIPQDAIVLDPGLGFSKTSAHSIELLRELSRVAALGYPVLVGASRKRFIGELTGTSVPSQRVIGSAVAHLLAVQRGAAIVRTHDVAATRDALAVLAAL